MPADSDSDIEILGSTSLLSSSLPHSRCDCPVDKFLPGAKKYDANYAITYVYTAAETTSNSQVCPNCYCFVCQLHPTSCKDWKKGMKHCNGSSVDTLYKRAREVRSNPFYAVLEQSFTKGDKSTVIPDWMSRSIRDMRDCDRSIERQIENYEYGNRQARR